MNRWLPIFLIFAVGSSAVSAGETSISETKALCSDSWYQFVEEQVSTGDGLGHGPDLGSDEWKSVIEFKLGLRDKMDIPRWDSEAWCRHIDQIVRSDR
jgi:hypothetical protein